MKLLSNMLHRVVYGPLPKPFAALTEPPLDFVSPEAMQPVVADYQRDKTAWRLNHLPLVVGQLRPEAMTALTGTATEPNIELSKVLAAPDFELCARQITRGLQRNREAPPKYKSHLQHNLLSLWAGVAQTILAQDRVWFGESTVSSIFINREVILPPSSHSEGSGRYKLAGIWHRDALTDDNGAVSRLYLMRTRLPMRMLPNRLTDGFKDTEKGDVIDPRVDSLAERAAQRPEPGQIVLVNGGRRFGSVHAAYVPKPGEGGPSCFIAVNCVI